MKPTRVIIGAAIAIGLGAAALGLGSPTQAQPYGWGMMGGYGAGGYGPGWMHGYGRGWTGGYGPQNCPFFQGTAGPGAYGQQGDLNLSTDDVKTRFERWIDLRGNPRLKVGDIRTKDADTFEVDIVTKDNSLVEQFLVNRHTGFYRPSGS